MVGKVRGDQLRVARNATAPCLGEVEQIGAPGTRCEAVTHQISDGVGQAVDEINFMALPIAP